MTIAPTPIAPGTELAHYKIIAMLGRGMGEVYLAEDQRSDASSIKLLHRNHSR